MFCTKADLKMVQCAALIAPYGLGRQNVSALVDCKLELPNDISGVVYINLDEGSAWQLQLAKEMKQSGYKIDMDKLI